MEGQTLGKYRILSAIGRGAAGTVWRAVDTVIERTVAIKTIRLDEAGDAETAEEIARFKREAQAAGRLSHPNVVQVYDYGEAAGLAYLVMEYVEGGSLKSLLDRGERLPLKEVARVMDELLAALEHAHEKGIVHRDIKPANIMLTKSGQVKVTDFGIARIESSTMTQAGTVLGTPAYMSPEQFRGEPVDHRTDLYSAGVVLYQLLTGDRPFDGTFSAIMHKALTVEPPRPSEISVSVPPALDAVVARAMAKRPQARFASAAEFRAALVQALRAAEADPLAAIAAADQDATVVGRPPAAAGPAAPAGTMPAPSPAAAAERRRGVPVVAIAGGAAGLAAVAAGVWFLVVAPAPEPPAPVAAVQPAPAPAAPAAPPVAVLQPVTPPPDPPAAPLPLRPEPPAATTPAAPAAPTPVRPDPPAVALAPPAAAPTPAPAPVAPAPAQPAPPVAGLSPAQPAAPPVAPARPEAAAPLAPPPAPVRPEPPAAVAPVPPRAEPVVPVPAPTPAPGLAPVVPPAVPPRVDPLPPAPARPEPPAAVTPVAPPAAPPPAPAPAPVRPEPPAAIAPVAPSAAPAPVAPAPRPDQLALAPTAAALRSAVAAALAASRCSLVSGDVEAPNRVRLTGYAQAGGGEAALRLRLASAGVPWEAVDWRVRGFEGPYCEALDLLRPYADPFGEPPSGLGLALDGDRRRLVLGDLLTVRLSMPRFAGYLRVSYFTHDGEVVHLHPNSADAARPFAAGARVSLGDPAQGGPRWEIGPPYGTEMIVAIASERPLFDAPREDVEPSARYLAALRDRLAGGRAGRVAARVLMVEVAER